MPKGPVDPHQPFATGLRGSSDFDPVDKDQYGEWMLRPAFAASSNSRQGAAMGMKCMFVILGLLACVAVRDLAAAEVPSEADAAAKLLATEVCSTCHGPGGRSTFPAIPNLAAQPWPYLSAKMKTFRNRAGAQSAGHVDVLGLMLLDDATDVALARYFANLSPAAPVAGDAALVAAGGKIYTQGDAEKGIAPCAACHGADASGFWIFPRLAGQRAEYVSRQLRLIQSRLRGSRLMHGVIQSMDADEMKAVAAFVQSK